MPFDVAGLGETTKVLIEARRRVVEDWWDGSSPFHGHCAVWAITRESVGAMIFPALEHLERAIYGSNSDQPSLRVRAWNDEPGRTQKEVVVAYDIAIAASV